MDVHVDAPRNDQLPRGVDGAGAPGDDEVVAHESDHAILTTQSLLQKSFSRGR